MIAENQKLVRVRRDEPERTCIVCPIGCRLHIEVKDDGELTVTGNRCKRGEAYAREEYEDPRRIVTATCAIAGGTVMRMPVRSTGGVPVDRLTSFLNDIYEIRLEAPVVCGETVAENVADTGVGLVATATIGRAEGEQEESNE
jgi:CxxC motif-containing protein